MISCVACLRQRYRGSWLSAEALELLLSSWRTQSSQSYESFFGNWACWCSEWDFDLISGPLADVANFLAHLHEEDYQSHSLNGHRSAISSVHATVNGVEVGKQPITLHFWREFIKWDSHQDHPVLLIWLPPSWTGVTISQREWQFLCPVETLQQYKEVYCSP